VKLIFSKQRDVGYAVYKQNKKNTMKDIRKFVINLERRPDRIESLNLPFDFEIFTATDGKITFPDAPIKLIGHYGCWDSHRRLLEKIKQENIEYTLILEDDVVVIDNFNEVFQLILNELPEDWDLLYLGGWNKGEIKKYSEHLNIAEHVLTTHCFLVRQKFVDTMLETINSNKFKIDVVFSKFLPMGKCFISNPIIAWQRENYSDIEHKVTSNLHLR